MSYTEMSVLVELEISNQAGEYEVFFYLSDDKKVSNLKVETIAGSLMELPVRHEAVAREVIGEYLNVGSK